jgi:sugar phosphate isomerase/epimerase
MKISVTSWSFPACTLKESWGIANALGISHLDLGLLHGASLDRDLVLSDPTAAAAEVKAMGISAANLYWLFGDTPDERPLSDPAALEQNMADYTSVLTFAEALDIPTLFLLPGVSKAGQSEGDLLASSAQALRAMMPLAEYHGIALSVEPHVGGLLKSPNSCLAFVDTVPGLKLTLDYAHFACMGFVQSEIDPLARHAAHVHMRQARPGALQAKMAEGTLDFVAMVETLRSVDYDGFLSIEYVHQGYMNTLFDDVLTETIHMRNLLQGCGAI